MFSNAIKSMNQISMFSFKSYGDLWNFLNAIENKIICFDLIYFSVLEAEKWN